MAVPQCPLDIVGLATEHLVAAAGEVAKASQVGIAETEPAREVLGERFLVGAAIARHADRDGLGAGGPFDHLADRAIRNRSGTTIP